MSVFRSTHGEISRLFLCVALQETLSVLITECYNVCLESYFPAFDLVWPSESALSRPSYLPASVDVVCNDLCD